MSGHRDPERIGVGIDGSTASHAAVRWAIAHARPGDQITLLHAWRPSPVAAQTGLTETADSAGAEELVRRELARAHALPRRADVQLTGEVLQGDARRALCAADVDLLVIGGPTHGRIASAVLGCVSDHLSHHIHRPLVVVPQCRGSAARSQRPGA